MTEHKKQHFIPEGYLKEWCDPDCPPMHEPYVWRFQKDSKEGQRKAPKNIFRETDMYTIKSVNGDRDLTLERGLSQLESVYCSLRDNKLLRHIPLDPDEHFF